MKVQDQTRGGGYYIMADKYAVRDRVRLEHRSYGRPLSV